MWLGVFAFFGYLLYLFLGWLFVGAGFIVLILGLVVGVNYFVFDWLPERMSKRAGQTSWESTRRKWELTRSIQLLLLFVVGVVLGSYWIPKQLHFGTAWYWRILLGMAVGAFALVTRRYR